MLLKPFTLHTPQSVQSALDLCANLDSYKLQSGGTFLINNLKSLKKRGTKTPEHIISLRKINELKGIQEENGRLIIKAMTTISELQDSPLLTSRWAVFKVVCKDISTNQIRNMATIGGNLACRYTWTEMPAVMIGLDADMHFMGSDGKEEVINAEEFFQNAAKSDKIFTHVSIKKDPEASVVYRRVKKTPYVDIPLLSLLIKTNMSGGKFTHTRVSINNCVAFAQRDNKLENFLNQSKCSGKTAEEALNHLDESIYDTRSSDYKKHMFRVSIKDAIAELINRN